MSFGLKKLQTDAQKMKKTNTIFTELMSSDTIKKTSIEPPSASPKKNEINKSFDRKSVKSPFVK